jgi:hypothetical protein
MTDNAPPRIQIAYTHTCLSEESFRSAAADVRLAHASPRFQIRDPSLPLLQACLMPELPKPSLNLSAPMPKLKHGWLFVCP